MTIRFNIIFIVIFLNSFISVDGQNTPSSISGLTVWLRADTNLTLQSGSISEWKDISGNNYIFQEIDSSKQPSFIASNFQINNHPCVTFDGINDRLLSTTNVVLGNQGSSIYIVANLLSQTNYGMFVCYGVNNPGSWNFRLRPTAPNITLINGSNNLGAGLNNPSPINLVNKGFAILSGSINSGSDEWKIMVDGSTSDSLISTFSQADSNYISIGYRDNNAYNNFNLAEIIIFNKSLNESEHNSIVNYIRNRYAPPVELGDYIKSVCDTIITLTVPNYFSQVLWSTGDTTNSITLFQSDTINVQVTDVFGIQSSDTIILKDFEEKFTINTISDTVSCGESVSWNTGLDSVNYSFMWNNGDTIPILNIIQTGDYWVKVTDSLECFAYSDTITVAIDSFAVETSLGPDKTVCQGERINLVSGENINSYLWSTTDTTNQVIVDTAGLYWIQVFNTNGCLAQDTIQITVNGIAPSVLFQVNDTCDNEFIIFNNNSFTTDGSNITDIFWDFGTGDTSSVINPQYQYPSTGLFNVELVVNTDSGCSNSIIKQIQIREKPTAGFFPSSILICSNQSTLFNDNSFSNEGVINSWNWDFGDTSISDTSSLQNGVYSFSSFGSYNVELIVTTEHGCKDTVSQFVNVKQSPSANFSSEGNCVNQQVKFSNSSNGNLLSTTWDFGDANSSSLTNPNHTYSLPNNYNVLLVVKDLNGCYDTLQNMITISDNPSANFIPDDLCVLTSKQFYDSSSTAIGTITDWFWDVRNYGYTSTNQNPLLYFNEADSGIYQLKLRVTNNYGCSDSLEKDISVHPLPQPNFSFSPEVGSPPLLVQFTNLSYGGNSYLWDFGDGIISSAFSPNHTYNDSSVLEITLVTTSLYGCIDSVKKTIQVIEPLVDIAINNVSYSFVSGTEYMKVIVQLANYGIVDITNVDLQLSISNFGNTLEKWMGNLPAQMQQLYTLNTFVEIPRREIPDVICVEAINPNTSLDDDLSNNRYCKTLDKFELINVYPNPVSQYITIEYILPTEKNIDIILNNSLGEKVNILFEGVSSKGFNIHQFNLGTYSNGVYIIELKDGENTFRKKIMIN